MHATKSGKRAELGVAAAGGGCYILCLALWHYNPLRQACLYRDPFDSFIVPLLVLCLCLLQVGAGDTYRMKSAAQPQGSGAAAVSLQLPERAVSMRGMCDSNMKNTICCHDNIRQAEFNVIAICAQGLLSVCTYCY